MKTQSKANTSARYYESLFDPASQDRSIWHGYPGGMHAFGHQSMHTKLAAPKPAASMVDTTADGVTQDGRRHWPSLVYGTLWQNVLEALNVWVENDGVGRDSFVCEDWQWFPSHLTGRWRAGDLGVELTVCAVDEDRARVQVILRNQGGAALTGRLIVQGDDNRTTTGQKPWYRSAGRFAWADNGCAVVTRNTSAGLSQDVFPYQFVLKPEDQEFKWIAWTYQFAWHVAGEGWERTSAEANGYATWRCSRPITLAAGQSMSLEIGFAGKWLGRGAPTADGDRQLAAQAATAVGPKSFAVAVETAGQRWREFYAKVPPLKQDWPADWGRLYYKAWTCVYFDLIPAGDLALFESAHPLVTTLKIAHSTFMFPASWECALGALLLALVDPQLGSRIIEGMYATTGEDGFMAEWVGNTHMSQLALVEPFVAWACYRRSGDKSFLDRIYPNLLKNVRYKLLHPTFIHLGPLTCRNMAYGYIGTLYTIKIAEVLGRPAKEMELLAQWRRESRAAVHSFWDEKGGFYRSNFSPGSPGGGGFGTGTDADTLIPLFAAAKESVRPRLLELIEKEYVTDEGIFARTPRTLPAEVAGTLNAKPPPFSIKDSNHMYLMKAIKNANRPLFDRIVRGTLANIAKANDFYEGYTLDGVGRHNGPNTIFGAFAVIWDILLSEGVVDDLFE